MNNKTLWENATGFFVADFRIFLIWKFFMSGMQQKNRICLIFQSLNFM